MSIKGRLYLLLFCALGGFIGIFIASLVDERLTTKLTQLEVLALEGEIQVLQARRHEKNLIMRHDFIYVDKTTQQLDLLRGSLQHIAAIDPSQDVECRRAISEVSAYQKDLQDLAELMKQMGLDETQGLLGDFVEAARNMDSTLEAVHDKDARIALLELRRAEKNFLQRSDAKYGEIFAARHTELKKVIHDLQIADGATGSQLQLLLEAYTMAFDNYSKSMQRERELIDALVKQGRDMEPLVLELKTHYREKRERFSALNALVINIIELATAFVVCLLIWWTVRGVTRSLDSLRGYTRAVAGGDRSAAPTGTFQGEFAQLRDHVTDMVQHLNATIHAVEQQQIEAATQAEKARQAEAQALEQQKRVQGMFEKNVRVAGEAMAITSKLAEAAQELSAMAEQVARGAAVQKDRMIETATAMEEMNATVMEIARNAGQASQAAQEASHNASQGAGVVQQAGDSMKAVNQITEALKQTMRKLSMDAQGIGEVITVINEIADQTNLLALNAAIEAARAGDAGKGFAVVADEVRKLAEKTMSATHEVEQRIKAIQDASNTATENMENASQAVRMANEQALASANALETILTLSDNTALQVQSIAAASEEQSAASEQINTAVDQVSQIAAESAAGMEQSLIAARELAQIAESLEALMKELEG